MTEWRPVVGYEPFYEVSDSGVVRCTGKRRCKGPHIMKFVAPDSHRYLRIGLTNQIGTRLRYVHHLVAEAFLGPRPVGLELNHKDGDRSNNRPENLEYVSARENTRHAIESGLWNHAGERNGRAKLTRDAVQQIRRLAALGASHPELAVQFGVSRSAIYFAVTRRSWA